MAKIYHIKKVPSAVLEWFSLNFPRPEFAYKFYWYDNGDGVKIYGCNVYQWVGDKMEFYHNATQASLEWFIINSDKKIYSYGSTHGS